jgi:serine/threonine-protein kinase
MNERQEQKPDLLERGRERNAQVGGVCDTELREDCPELREEERKKVKAIQNWMDDNAGVNPTPDGVAQPVLAPQDTTDASDGEGKPCHTGMAIPGYEILGELGRGGMGVVYKARQVGLNRVVALKMILAGQHASFQEKASFLAEAEAAATVQHPGIVEVYELGTCEGLPYCALEYCLGGTLRERLKKSPLLPDETARLMEAVAWAMQAAHETGIVHRDLKPANILLDADGNPRVADFGLARRLGRESLTPTGAVMGTPEYMAPEQVQGKKQVGPAVDVWALGVILYELLTGRPPFHGPTILETFAQVCQEEPVAPRQIEPTIPRDLETVCLKCLRKEPGRRYQSARAVAEELSRWRRLEPIIERPVGVLEKVWMWARRNPVAAALLLYVGLLIAVLIPGSLWLAHDQGRRLEGEVCRSNRFAAAHVASTIERHLERIGEQARRLSADPELQALWHRGETAGWQEQDRKRLHSFFKQKRTCLNAAFRRGEAGEGGPFSSLTLLNGQGRFVASSIFKRELIGRDFGWRDFFIGGRDPGRGGTGRQFHVSRAFKSAIEPVYKLALSVPFCPDGNKPAGVVAATIAAGPTFGLENLHDGRRNVALLAREDTSPPRGPGPRPEEPLRYLVLLHPKIKEGTTGVGLPSVQRPKLDGAGVGESDTYRDPCTPGERWLAGFSSVGGTDLIVVVQQRHADAVAPYQSVLEHLWAWGLGAAAIPFVIWIISRLVTRGRTERKS